MYRGCINLVTVSMFLSNSGNIVICHLNFDIYFAIVGRRFMISDWGRGEWIFKGEKQNMVVKSLTQGHLGCAGAPLNPKILYGRILSTHQQYQVF